MTDALSDRPRGDYRGTRTVTLPDGKVIDLDALHEPAAVCLARHPQHPTWVCMLPANHEGDHA